MPKKRFGKAKMKNMWCSFRPWFSSGLWHFVLINKSWKMYETAIPMGKMLNAFLAIHGRCKFIIFLRGQTPSLSAPTLILSLMEHFQGKAKNTLKHSIKSTFSISIQLNCNWLPGNPQLPPYIYTHTRDIKIREQQIVANNAWGAFFGASQICPFRWAEANASLKRSFFNLPDKLFQHLGVNGVVIPPL